MVGNSEIELMPKKKNAEQEFEEYIESVRLKAQDDKEWARIYTPLLRIKRDEVNDGESDAGEIISSAREVRDCLRDEFRETGICPICQFRVLLDEEACLDTEREHDEDREVAGVGLSDRPPLDIS